MMRIHSQIKALMIITLALICGALTFLSDTNAGFDAECREGYTEGYRRCKYDGEPLRDAEREMIREATDKLRQEGASANLQDAARCIDTINNKMRINAETGTTTALGTTESPSPGSRACTDDRMNINADLLDAPGRYDGEAADVITATTLAHESDHARSRVPSERSAFRREIEAANFLLMRVTDERAMEALEEVRQDRERRLQAMDRREGGRSPVDFLAAAGSADTPDLSCRLSISSEEPSSLFISTFQTETIRSRREPLAFVERPLAVIHTQFGGQPRVLIAGTALKDSVGRVESLQLGLPPNCAIQGKSQLIFKEDGARPTSLAADESTGNVYVLEDRFKRLLVVKADGSVIEIASSARSPELADMVSIRFDVSVGDEPPLTATSLPWFADYVSPLALRFLLSDVDGDLVVDRVTTQRLREAITFEPSFTADPMMGETQALVEGTPGSTVVLFDEQTAVVGSIVIPIEGFASMPLTRPLALGERVDLVDRSLALAGQSTEVSPVRPFIVALNPDFGAAAGGDLIELTGKNFAGDSQVFIEGIEAMVTSVEPTRIVAVTPPSPLPVSPLQPAFVTVEVRSSAAAASVFTDFAYLDPADLPFEVDTDQDLIPDIVDNCPNVANPGQKDSNLNQVGDACEVGEVVIAFKFLIIKVEIEGNKFEAEAAFTLGADSDGINPLTEVVTLKVGIFSTTIPAGSFTRGRAGEYRFEGVIGGVKLVVVTHRLADGVFVFKAVAEGANLTGTVNPVTVELSIGNDGGRATGIADIK
jgi:hypothetical protein